MTWLHPWYLMVGAAALALPLVIHWLTRPKPRRMALSTVRFVQEVVRQRRARHRLRDALILACRIAAVMLLAWAFARPFLGARHPAAPAESASAVVRVVVIDTSQSMAASDRGVQLFERARAAAAGYLSYSPDVSANLIFAAAQARPVFERVSDNFGAMRDELNQARPLPQRLNLDATINMAADLLARSGDAKARRELVLISDFQRTNWSAADFARLPKDTLIKYESVAPAQPLENLAILRVAAQKRVEQERPFTLEVEVGNFTPAARQVAVEVSIGESTWRLEGNCPKGAKTMLSKELVIKKAGWQAGMASLIDVDDALAADNRRPFALDVRPAPIFAMLTREPARLPANSSHYLERALNPTKTREGAERVVRVDPMNVDQQAVTRADVIVLNRPGKLSQGVIELLAGLLRRGKGIIYTASDANDAVNLKLLAEAAGTDLKLPVDFEPPPAAQAKRELTLLDIRRDQPPFAVFGGDLSGINGLKFAGMLNSQPKGDGLKEEILASYNDQTAALVLSPCAGGMIAVLNADLAQSDLVGSDAFVPLMGELVERLVASHKPADALACGERAAIVLPAEAGLASDLVVEASVEGQQTGSLADERGSVLWVWNSAGDPGVYQIKRKNDRAGGAVYAVATAAPAAESELSYLDASVLTERLSGGRSASYAGVGDANGDKQGDTAWVWLLVACAAVMLTEIVALRSFRT